MRPPSGEQFEIVWGQPPGEQRAVVVEVGGGVRSYAVDGAPVLDGYDVAERASGGAGQLLAPWPNRIRDGRYTVAGRPLQLAISEPGKGTAIHGLVRWASWFPQQRSADSVVLTCVLNSTPGYPFPLHLQVRWSVGPDGLRAEHAVTNLGEQAAPFGLGVHPYLALSASRVDELILTMPAATRLLVDERGLPSGTAPVAGTEADYRAGRRIGAAVLDTAYGDLDRDSAGVARVHVADPTGRRATVWMGPQFGFAQVFSADTLPEPHRRRSLAVEPMTCPPDAFNSGVGLVMLEPGATWSATWGISAGCAGRRGSAWEAERATARPSGERRAVAVRTRQMRSARSVEVVPVLVSSG